MQERTSLSDSHSAAHKIYIICNVKENTYSLSANLGNNVLPPVKMMLERTKQIHMNIQRSRGVQIYIQINDTSQKAPVEDTDGMLVQPELYTQQAQLDLYLYINQAVEISAATMSSLNGVVT